MNNRLIKSNDAGGGGACTNTVDLYNPFPDGSGQSLWQLNGDATDVSGSFNGTWNGTPAYSEGIFGQSANFAGTQGITLANNVMPYNNFTISFWFKADWVAIDYLLSFSRYGNTSFSTRTTGTVEFFSRGTTASENYSATIDYSSSTDWHNIVFTKSSTSGAALYSDGQFVWSDPSFTQDSSFYDGNNRINSIGASWKSGAFLAGCNALIDQVRVFTRALRPYEVEALYTEEYCTPTIVPSEHFNTVLYTGNATARSITGVGFQPDFTWIKNRDAAQHHNLIDSVRGNTKLLYSTLTNAEATTTNHITSFDSDGFSLGTATSANGNGNDIVSWNFKAGGAAVTNTDGTITSQVSANTEAGFSVVSCTATGGVDTIGHGLGVAPSVIIYKTRSTTGNWSTYHQSLGNTRGVYLNLTSAAVTSTFFWNNTSPTSDVFTAYGSGGDTHIAYCFAEVEGFSNFGSFLGTGTTEGQLVVTGFEPAFVMWKKTSVDASSHWNIVDNKRSPLKDKNNVLYSNLTQGEDVTSYDVIDFNANGFQVKAPYSQFNQSGATFIYMAFAADPTTIEPSLEDSFNTVLYTSTGGSQSITGLGFQPDLLWTKNRTSTWFHQIVDSVRLAPNTIYSNSTQAESTPVSYTSSLDTDGFTVNYTETIGSNYVAWAWKGAELPAINSNGSIPSVVSANPAAGFSIVSTKSNGSGYLNFGHGLDSAPELVITKFTSQAGEWYTYTSAIANGFDVALKLNGSDAAITAYGADKWSSTDSVVGVGNPQWYFTANVPFITYCFHSVAGFSKIGSYDGTNSVGNKQTMDFEPAFVLIKPYNVGGSWVIFDNKRNTTNPRTKFIRTNTSDAEGTSTGLDFYNDGFDFNGSNLNVSGYSYIYMAFANQF